MLGRGLLFGVAVGCVLGVYVAPHLSRLTVGMGHVSGSILPQMNEATAVLEKGTWPTDDQAKTQLFARSKWDPIRHGKGSTVSVKRCIQIAYQEIACELSAQLKWIGRETQIEAVFQEEGGDWKMIAAKNR
ncbi:hypothetical protein GOB25_19160 [Sinorhizobium meliloti]|nr:hypothetical protein [Sinorhizobium meliloti]